jgi:hypothetical protein
MEDEIIKLELKKHGDSSVIVRTEKKQPNGEGVPVLGLDPDDWVVKVNGKEVKCDMICQGDGIYVPDLKGFEIALKKDMKTEGFESVGSVRIDTK